MSDIKERLLKPRLPEDEVDVPGIGTVRLRGLSHDEVISMRKATDAEVANIDGPRSLVIERKTIALAMVDPTMTEEEVAQWQACSPAGEMVAISEKVQELSGMQEDADKAAYKSAGG